VPEDEGHSGAALVRSGRAYGAKGKRAGAVRSLLLRVVRALAARPSRLVNRPQFGENSVARVEHGRQRVPAVAEVVLRSLGMVPALIGQGPDDDDTPLSGDFGVRIGVQKVQVIFRGQ
jgi:hypothetical protein